MCESLDLDNVTDGDLAMLYMFLNALRGKTIEFHSDALIRAEKAKNRDKDAEQEHWLRIARGVEILGREVDALRDPYQREVWQRKDKAKNAAKLRDSSGTG